MQKSTRQSMHTGIKDMKRSIKRWFETLEIEHWIKGK